MTYVQTTLIIDGALESEYDIPCEKFDSFFDGLLLEDANGELDDVTAELYVINHEHEPTTECECVQYLTDHRPFWTNKQEVSHGV